MKRFKIIALIMAITMLFTGCYKETFTYVINSDNSGTVTLVRQMEKNAANKYFVSQGYASAEEYFKSNSILVTEETIEGSTYYKMEHMVKIKSGELEKRFINSFKNTYDVYMTNEVVYITMDPYFSDEEYESYSSMAKKENSEINDINIEFVFEKPVVNTNGTIDPLNPNKVTFKMPYNDVVYMFATTNSDITEKTIEDKIIELEYVKSTKIKKLKANKVKGKKASITLSFKKVKGTIEYDIQYSKNKKFKKAKIKSTKKTKFTIKKLEKNTKYYVRVRVSKYNYAGQWIVSEWSKKKSIVTKK